MYCLGIDVGTGGTRALLVDEKGTVKAGFTSPHENMRMEKPLWAEQRPEDWWQAAVKAIQGVLAAAGDAKAGQAVYTKTCKACHGAQGEGNPAIAKMLKVPIPDLGSAVVQGKNDDLMKKDIVAGKGKMQPVKTLSAGEAQNVVAYVRTLKK